MATITNATTGHILQFLYTCRIFAWRHNVLPIPLPGGGYRSGGKSGVPDIIGILPNGGKFLGIEIKTGRDRLRPEQIGFHTTARSMGAVILVVKDFDDFLEQFKPVLKELKIKYD